MIDLSGVPLANDALLVATSCGGHSADVHNTLGKHGGWPVLASHFRPAMTRVSMKHKVTTFREGGELCIVVPHRLLSVFSVHARRPW